MDEPKNEDAPEEQATAPGEQSDQVAETQDEATPKQEQIDEEELEASAESIEENTTDQVSQKEPVKEETPAPDTKSKMPSMKVVAPIIVLVLLLVGGFVFMMGDDDSTEQASTSEVETEDKVVALASAVSLVEGTVQTSDDGETWTDATGGETVTAGQYVRTLADSRTVLLHDDGSAIRLDANSTVTLSVSDSNSVEVMLVSGQVYTRIVESETRTFAVVTERERFEALGTAFKTGTDGTNDDVEVYESNVKVDSDETTVEEGNKYDTETKDVTSIDFDALKDDEFVQWNKQKDSEDENFKNKLGVLNKEIEDEPEEVPAPEPTSPSSGITLSGQATDDGVKLSWELAGVSSTDGFKIVHDKSDSTPTYKENTSKYVSDGASRTKTIGLSDGNSYYFRVCIYRASAGTCDTYSNAVQVTTPEKTVTPVVSGAVELTIEGNVISWGFGGTAPHGFKVVMNSNGEPVYPANSIKYVGAGTTSITLPEKPDGTYAVRVCKYTADSGISGGCTDYSNEVAYVVGGEGEGEGEEE